MKIANKSKVYGYFAIYLLIFGAKFGGIFDISLLMSIAIILCNIRSVALNHYNIRLTAIVFLLLIYSIILMLFTGNSYYIFCFKFIRVLVAVIGIGTYIKACRLSKESIINIIVNILISHALVIIMESTLWLDLQNILKPITGFDRVAMGFRGTGFTNGYDFAGILCNFGLLIICHYSRETIKRRRVKILIFIIATLLTSRFNMLLSIALMGYMGYIDKSMEIKEKRFFKIVSLVGAFPVVGIFLFSTSNFDNIFVNVLLKIPFFANLFSKLIYHYADANVKNTINAHYDFSSLSATEIIFGKMINVKADPGYTQYIYAVGFLGVIIALTFYIQLIRSARCFKIDDKLYKIVVVIIFVIIFMSMKNSYLLARHVTELLLILFFTGCYKNEVEIEQ